MIQYDLRWLVESEQKSVENLQDVSKTVYLEVFIYDQSNIFTITHQDWNMVMSSSSNKGLADFYLSMLESNLYCTLDCFSLKMK